MAEKAPFQSQKRRTQEIRGTGRRSPASRKEASFAMCRLAARRMCSCGPGSGRWPTLAIAGWPRASGSLGLRLEPVASSRLVQIEDPAGIYLNSYRGSSRPLRHWWPTLLVGPAGRVGTCDGFDLPDSMNEKPGHFPEGTDNGNPSLCAGLRCT